MNHLARLLFCLYLACSIGAAVAAANDLQTVPPLSGPLVDRAGALQPDEAAQIDRQLRRFSQTHGSQIAVLIVPTTQPESIEQYSIRVFDTWKLGRRNENDGILLLVATNDRKLRIDTGYGLEGAIPDAIAKRIVAEIVAPRLRGGDMSGGLIAGIEQIEKLIAGEHLPPAPGGANGTGKRGGNSGGSNSAGGFGQMLVIGIVAATIVGGLLCALLGRFLGSLATGGAVGAIAWAMTGSVIVMLAASLIVFVYVLITGGHGGMPSGGRGGGGNWGGGSNGWSGGGGSAGGGGASGSW